MVRAIGLDAGVGWGEDTPLPSTHSGGHTSRQLCERHRCPPAPSEAVLAERDTGSSEMRVRV